MEDKLSVETGVSYALASYRSANIANVWYRLYFDVPAASHSPVSARSEIRFDLASGQEPLQLDFREDSVLLQSLVCNGEAVEIDHRNEHLVIPAGVLKVGENSVKVAFTAGDLSLNRNPEYLYTLFVPDRARTAFPLFDQPDLKAIFELTLDLPSHWRALANAPLAGKEEIGDKTRYVFNPTEPVSSYLFAFVAGEFEQVTRDVDGRQMSMLHRETDSDKLARNIEPIFQQHANAIDWMERYTGMDYPFSKLDFALIPGFTYSGMEHVGAIFYRADKLLLEKEPTELQLLGRATLIAHETAHMWFGNLVTMAWFNDVWTKEVFANFMAAKMVNPEFPDIDHPLSFLVDHYPAAYEVDRSEGANPIRQELPNLAEAGQMYGSIIYHKAPIMMRQLELMLGEHLFREGIREYLRGYANGNVTWHELIAILDAKTRSDLIAWSDVWVNSPGRPIFQVQSDDCEVLAVNQLDPAGSGRVWPQQFEIAAADGSHGPVTLTAAAASVPWPGEASPPVSGLLFNSDAMGYGLFPAELGAMNKFQELGSLQRGSLLVNLNENLLAGNRVNPVDYLDALLQVLTVESNALVIGLALDQAVYVYQTILLAEQQLAVRPKLEALLRHRLDGETDGGRARQFYMAFTALATSGAELEHMLGLWSGEGQLAQLTLSEADQIRLAQILAIRLPGQAEKIITVQLARCENPDNRRRLAFLAPSVSSQLSDRRAFFASLADIRNRETESWVLDGLENLHHPSRTDQSVEFLDETLALLEEVQRTGDIFFPMGWLRSSFRSHNSAQALAVAARFLQANPGYSAQLRMKIQQAVDRPARAFRLRASEESQGLQ